MADNQYITIMLQSLQKKEKVLNSIIQINKRQKEELGILLWIRTILIRQSKKSQNS